MRFIINNYTTAGTMERDQEQNKGIHLETFRSEGSSGPVGFHYSLYRFDIGLEFHMSNNIDFQQLIISKCGTKFSKACAQLVHVE